MPATRAPRHGSLQYVPHAQSQRVFARVRSWGTSKDAKPLGFVGFKAGMSHVAILDTKKNSPTKGFEVSSPVTVIECPPLKIAGIREYRRDAYGMHAIKDHFLKTDKILNKRVGHKETKFPETLSCDSVTLLVYTQPSLTSTGQKKPNVMEIAMGGKPADALAFVKEHKELKISEVLKAGQYVDVHSITKGRGFQGVVRKNGVGIRRHKSEKVKRGAVMGPEGYAKVTFEAAMPGKFGNHTRTEFNKKILAIRQDPADVNPKGGFLRYGLVKNEYLLLKGSVPGLKHAMIRFVIATRKDPKATEEAPAIEYISKESQQ